MTRIHAAVLAIGVAACTHTAPPSSPAGRAELEQKANVALTEMRRAQPGIDGLLGSAAGYAVFPNVGAAGALYVGGAYGKGVLYQNGTVVGFVELKQGSVGLTLGGKTYAELLILRTQYDVDRLKAGKFEVGADVSAVVLTAGGGAAGTLDPNTTVIVKPHGGLMAEVTVSGQRIDFAPAG
jgi:lipid-binding SYLF domain-containing protein